MACEYSRCIYPRTRDLVVNGADVAYSQSSAAQTAAGYLRKAGNFDEAKRLEKEADLTSRVAGRILDQAGGVMSLEPCRNCTGGK